MVVFVRRIVLCGYLLDVCYFVYVYIYIFIYIVGVSCVLARAKYMAYTFVLMMFWILLIFQLTV